MVKTHQLMGRHKKGQAVKRTDVWAEAGGKEAIVFQFLKADILNWDQGYSSAIWSDISIALFGEDTRKNRHCYGSYGPKTEMVLGTN